MGGFSIGVLVLKQGQGPASVKLVMTWRPEKVWWTKLKLLPIPILYLRTFSKYSFNEHSQGANLSKRILHFLQPERGKKNMAFATSSCASAGNPRTNAKFVVATQAPKLLHLSKIGIRVCKVGAEIHDLRIIVFLYLKYKSKWLHSNSEPWRCFVRGA